MRGLDAGGRLAESEESFSNCGLGDGDEKKVLVVFVQRQHLFNDD